MSNLTPSSAATLDELVSALRRGDRARAERALAEGRVDAEGLIRLGELNIRRQRWSDAAWLFDRAGDCIASGGADLPPAFAFKRNLCRNLSAIAEHRPALAALLGGVDPSTSVTIAPSSTGHPTIAVRSADGQLAGQSANNRPLAAAEVCLQQLRPAMAKGLAIGLAGIGDGYLLYRLAMEDTKLFLTTQVPVFVIEPDPQIALHAMMIHDYTGPRGPLEQPRFHWFVGPDWASAYRAATTADLYLGAPAVTIGFNHAAADIRGELARFAREAADADNATRDRVESYYATYNPASLARAVTADAPRKPRVLLPTTRFSTVLQYSNHDTAEAFRSLGWEVRELIEPSPAHRMYQPAIRRELDEFKPDLVFQIDHLRHEHAGMFPPNLPFMCWVQDHLPHLTRPGVGNGVCPTDFVLTDTCDTYEEKYHYPRRQLLPLPKLTRSVPASRKPSHDGPDLVFVSNASQPPAQILDGLCNAAVNADLRQLVRSCGQRMFDAYAAGGSLQTYYGDILPLIRSVVADEKLKLTSGHLDEAARVLFHPLNDALYRQQTLAWAAAVATELNLRMELYGTGWEAHPTLSPFARGPVDPRAVADLSASSRINLQIVPYLCLHQRLLDGVMAGGFFAVRRHSADVDPGRLLDFLADRGLEHCRDTAAVREALPPGQRETFEDLRRAAMPPMCTTGSEDVVRMVRQWRDAGQLQEHAGPLPCFDEVSFDDEAGLRRCVVRYRDDAVLRDDVVRRQRESIDHRLTYKSGIARVVRQMLEILTADGRDNGATDTAREAA